MNGKIILLNNKKGLLPKLIKFFTNSKWTHNAITIDVGGNNCDVIESVLSAESFMAVYPLERYYENENYEFKIYQIVGVEQKIIDKIVLGIYKQSAFKRYAYLQLIWHCYRWLAEKLGFKVTHQKNWFPNNDVCSEQTYRFLYELSKEYCWLRELDYLMLFNENTFNPEDFYKFVKKFPERFRIVE